MKQLPPIRKLVEMLIRVHRNVVKGKHISNQDLVDLAIVIRELEVLEEKYLHAYREGRLS